MAKRKMSLKDAAALVPDDLPDGAYWAMAHEFSGADYGEACDELADDDETMPDYVPILRAVKDIPCEKCGKLFISESAMRQHSHAKHDFPRKPLLAPGSR